MPFDYYNACESRIDCAKWIAFVRLFCIVRTPACIYSKIKTPSTKLLQNNIGLVPVPDFVSNILTEFFAEVSAREAAIIDAGNSVTKKNVATGGGGAVWAESSYVVRDLLVEHGALPVRPRLSSRFRVGRITGLRVTEASVIRLGATCAERCAESVRAERGEMGKTLAAAVSALSQRDVEPAPLWLDEVNWVESQGYAWHGPILVRESYE
jgi:hypothetical protein